MKITPETPISINLLILVIGLLVGGAVSYGAMRAQSSTQGDQIRELSNSYKQVSEDINTLKQSYVRQEEINKQFVETLGDIKSRLNTIDANILVIRRNQ